MFYMPSELHLQQEGAGSLISWKGRMVRVTEVLRAQPSVSDAGGGRNTLCRGIQKELER